ncbi:MAG: hypothetical protein IPF92_01820 [Myxococcales bacterium]|nr:hypothetical protein [Myxococcales bacterium]MBL0193868.1 hypothetical protein [Myxococcales bacterium]HQY64929.1 thiamine pyrophosphate-dependent enzyme [Polyangiaceae bacterium]
MQDGTPATSETTASGVAPGAPIERVLSPEGEALVDVPIDEGAAVGLFRHMVRARQLDLRFIALQRAGDIPFYASSVGEEGATCAPPFALDLGDAYFPGPRSALGSLARAVTLAELVHQVFGTARSATRGRGLPHHVSSRENGVVSVGGVPGASLVHASGWGWAARMRGDRRACLAVVCGAAFASGGFHNALNFAGVGRANVVFACVVDSATLSSHTGCETVAEKGQAYGVPASRVDGRDALAVHAAITRALARARDGGGPSLVEIVSARAKPSEDGSIALPADDCPVLLLERYLERSGVDVAALRAPLEAELEEAFRLAVAEAKASASPGRASLFEDVYAEVPAHLLSQRDAFV